MDLLGLWTTGLSGYLSFSPFVPFGSTLASFEGPRQDRTVNLRCSQFGGCARAIRSRQQVRVTRPHLSQTSPRDPRQSRRTSFDAIDWHTTIFPRKKIPFAVSK